MMDRYPDYNFIRYLYQGDSFGEIALRERIPRTATIVCLEKCLFFTLNRDSYN